MRGERRGARGELLWNYFKPVVATVVICAVGALILMWLTGGHSRLDYAFDLLIAGVVVLSFTALTSFGNLSLISRWRGQAPRADGGFFDRGLLAGLVLIGSGLFLWLALPPP